MIPNAMISGPAFVDFLAEVALKATVLLVLAAVASFLARRSTAALRHRIWVSALAGIAALPILLLLLPPLDVPVLPPTPPVEATTYPPPVAGPSTDLDFQPTLPESQRSLEWQDWTAALYAAGVLASLAGLGLSLRRLRTLARRSISAEPHEHVVLERVSSALKLPAPALRIAADDGPAVPLTWGLRRPTLLLPAESAAWPEAQLLSALLHEAAHIRRRDWPLQLAARGIVAFYWFHPLARWAVARLRIEAERACDDLVLASGIPAADYAACLLEVTRMHREERSLPTAALPMAHGSALEERLRAVLDANTRRRESGRLVIAAVGGVVAGVVLLTAALEASPSRTPSGGTGSGAPSAAASARRPGGASQDMNAYVRSVRRETLRGGKAGDARAAELSRLRARLEAAEAEVRRLRSQTKGQPSKSGARLPKASGVLEALLSEKATFESKLITLRSMYTEEHIEVRQVRATLKSINAAIERERQSGKGGRGEEHTALSAGAAEAEVRLRAQRARRDYESLAQVIAGEEGASNAPAPGFDYEVRKQLSKPPKGAGTSRKDAAAGAGRAADRYDGLARQFYEGKLGGNNANAFLPDDAEGRIAQYEKAFEAQTRVGRGSRRAGSEPNAVEAAAAHRRALEKGYLTREQARKLDQRANRSVLNSVRADDLEALEAQYESVQTQIKHAELDVKFADMRLQRAEERLKAGTGSRDQVEAAQDRLENLHAEISHLRIDLEAAEARWKRAVEKRSRK